MKKDFPTLPQAERGQESGRIWKSIHMKDYYLFLDESGHHGLKATKIVYPDRENLAFRVIEKKIYRQFPNGDYLGYGLKIFP